MKATTIALALAALGWGFARQRQVKDLTDRLENLRSAHYRLNDQVRDRVEGLESEIRALRAQVRSADGGPMFTAEMTVGEATGLDPRVSDVLGAFHIGGCSSCAVSDTDTLAYAAAGNGQEVEKLLSALNQLNTANGSQVTVMLERRPNVQFTIDS
jgi:HAMP domain-containing protein